MYVITNKEMGNIVHINNAPLSQKLIGKDIYYNYDEDIHDILLFDGSILPEYWKIKNVGETKYIEEMNIQDKVDAGIIILEPDKTIKNNEIVDKTFEEKVLDGTITLEEAKLQKISGLKENTYSVITSHMPEWKQQTWYQFSVLHKKVLSNDINILDDIEKKFYETFSDQIYDISYSNYVIAMDWIINCKIENNNTEELIKNSITAEELLSIKLPTYPEWILN